MTTRCYHACAGSDGGRYTVYEYDDAPAARGVHFWKLASGHELTPTEIDGVFRTADGSLTVRVDFARASSHV